MGTSVCESNCVGKSAGTSDVDTIGLLTFYTPGTVDVYVIVVDEYSTFAELKYGTKATSVNSASVDEM